MTLSASLSVKDCRSMSLAMASLIMAGGSKTQEVTEKFFAGTGQNGFRMELHAFDAKGAVAKAHDLSLRGLSGDFQTGGERLAPDDQRMVARRFKRVGQIAKDRLLIMTDHRRLAMHQTFGANHLSAKCFSDALMTKTDTENRNGPRQTFDGVDGNPCFFRRAWPRRDHNALRLECRNLIDGHGVVPDHFQFLAQFAKILDQVIGERVVIVDDQYHGLV